MERNYSMTRTGLDIIAAEFPDALKGKRIGLLCHAASITSAFRHSVDIFSGSPCTLAAIFGPQHGVYGQTQDNMVEWKGYEHPVLKIPVYSLYAETRRPSAAMLEGLDAFVVDLQDVGARPYTYIWTVKLCMEACRKAGIEVWVLDRPNPVAAMGFDGPMLDSGFFSFVGGAPIPLCHRMTIGEIALLLKRLYFPGVKLEVVWMDGWRRNSLWPDTGLPWVLPSPNMPTVDTAVVYPGMVLLEATNMSEGRGTTRPFEIVGAPYFKADLVMAECASAGMAGAMLRRHDFIPAFQKWKGENCRGVQIHVTDARRFEPVAFAAAFLSAVVKTSGGAFAFKEPPYEYDAVHMPFDILSGDETLRTVIAGGGDVSMLKEAWRESYGEYGRIFRDVSQYPGEQR